LSGRARRGADDYVLSTKSKHPLRFIARADSSFFQATVSFADYHRAFRILLPASSSRQDALASGKIKKVAMFLKTPASVVHYSQATDRQLMLNTSRKRCAGCATMRSVGQFQPASSEYCLTCVRRGIHRPKSTVRRPLK
jgi:hypothetical protein